jgi:hypothetical protein
VRVPWGRYNIVRDLGVVVLGCHLVSLASVLCGLISVDPERMSYLQLGEEVFGSYDRRQVEAAKVEAVDWFPI